MAKHLVENNVDDALIDATPFWKRKRYLLVLLTFFGAFNIYALRINLSVAIVEMTKVKITIDEDGNTITEQLFDWNQKQKGIVLSSYFYGFVCTQVIGGLISQRIGGHLPFGIAIGVSSVLNLLTPLAASFSIYALIAVRVIDGLFEGVTFASLYSVSSKWIAPVERSRMVMIITSGGHIGAVVSLAASGFLAQDISWQSPFYVFGSIGCVWFVLWMSFIKSSPATEKLITITEREYIENSLNKETKNPVTNIPWKSILTSPPVWAIFLSHFADNWGLFTLQTQLPQFLKDALDFNIGDSGILSAVPYLCMAITLQLAGFIADYVQLQGILSTRNTRRFFNCGAFVGQVVCLFCAAFFISKVTSVTLISVGVSIAAFAHAGFSINFLEVAPQFVGIITGLSNTIAVVPGVLSPLITGFIVTSQTKNEWQIVFYIAAAIYLAGATIYWFFCQTDVQPWALQKARKQSEALENNVIERTRF